MSGDGQLEESWLAALDGRLIHARGGLAAGVERASCQPLQGMRGSGRRLTMPSGRASVPVVARRAGSLDEPAQSCLDGSIEAPLCPPAALLQMALQGLVAPAPNPLWPAIAVPSLIGHSGDLHPEVEPGPKKPAFEQYLHGLQLVSAAVTARRIRGSANSSRRTSWRAFPRAAGHQAPGGSARSQ
jgi:hypothetical protein